MDEGAQIFLATIFPVHPFPHKPREVHEDKLSSCSLPGTAGRQAESMILDRKDHQVNEV
jgi:hypothetical protein